MCMRLFTQWIAIAILIIFCAFSIVANERPYISKCIHIIQDDEDGKGFSYPSSLFYEPVKDEIYLIDSGHSRILIYTSDFFPLYSLDKDDGILGPICMTVDPKGYLFVGQSGNSKNLSARISVFNPCLKWKRDIYFKGFEGASKFVPKNIALDGEGRIYVAGTNHLGIVILDKKGKYISSIMPKENLEDGEKHVTICDVEIDSRGMIYLLSEEKGRVYIYNKDEEFLLKFGEKGGSSAKLSRPRGIAVDVERGMIFIIDYMRHAANVYDTKGVYIFEFGGRGWGEGWFQFPTDISVDGSSHVLVADTFNHRVQVIEIK